MPLLLITTVLAGTLAPWQVSWNAAATALNTGDAAGCLAELQDDLTRSENRQAWLDLGYTCAVSASDLARADHYREALGPAYQPRSALDIHHAWLKRRDGDPQEALGLLVPDGWTQPHQQSVGRTLQLTLLTETGKWDETGFLATDPRVDPRAQATLAQGLTGAGRAVEAHRVFAQACPRLETPEAWGCGSVLLLSADPETVSAR
jgi:hypothetical protein